jgi:Raf kinase inhibitor-like YbhB/YbcL family protein
MMASPRSFLCGIWEESGIIDARSSSQEEKMRPSFVSVVLSLVLIFSVPLALAGDAPETGALRLTSPVFENNSSLLPRYTCDGENMNPPLTIKNVPRGAKSLALILDDQDAPRGSYVHWIVWNIDPETKDIKENSVPENAVEGTNDFKKRNYGGPCPPTRAHRYVFTLYALNIRLNLEASSTKAALEKAMKGHILAQTQLLTSYKKLGK